MFQFKNIEAQIKIDFVMCVSNVLAFVYFAFSFLSKLRKLLFQARPYIIGSKKGNMKMNEN